MRTLILIPAFIALFAQACEEEYQRNAPLSEAELREQLFEYNKSKVEEEDQLINDFVKEHPFSFELSETGMRYHVFPVGGGQKIEKGTEVQITFTLRLFDSTLCYTRDKEQPFTFFLDESATASGFHELVRYMSKGDSAVAVWPARLGYGMTGDQDKIPQDAILLVDLKLLD